MPNAFPTPEQPWTDADERAYQNLGRSRPAPSYTQAAALAALGADVDVSKLSDEEFAERYNMLGSRDSDFERRLNQSDSDALRAEKAATDAKAAADRAARDAAANREIERLSNEIEEAKARTVLAEAEIRRRREREWSTS